MDVNFYNWSDKFKNLLGSIRSAGADQSILYVIRETKPDTWDPATNAKDEKEKIMYQVLLSGTEYNMDNKYMRDKLKRLRAWDKVDMPKNVKHSCVPPLRNDTNVYNPGCTPMACKTCATRFRETAADMG